MSILFLDIETGPDFEILDLHFPLGPAPDFDAGAIKYGNAKRPELRASIEADALLRHNGLVERWGGAEHLDAHRREKLDSSKALLNPCLSKLCAVGTLETGKVGDGGEAILDIDPEHEVLMLKTLAISIDHAHQIVGWNLKGFDCPYLAMRYMAHGLTPPQLILPERNGRFFGPGVIDLMEVCALGQPGRNYSLKHAGVMFGFPPNPEGAGGGKDFWKHPRERQEPYLR